MIPVIGRPKGTIEKIKLGMHIKPHSLQNRINNAKENNNHRLKSLDLPQCSVKIKKLATVGASSSSHYSNQG